MNLNQLNGPILNPNPNPAPPPVKRQGGMKAILPRNIVSIDAPHKDQNTEIRNLKFDASTGIRIVIRVPIYTTVEKALEELKNTDENTEVFKQAGNLLIKVDYKDALEEAEDKLETLKLRKQTMSRQEERVMKKLEEMQSNIQSAMQGMAPNGA